MLSIYFIIACGVLSIVYAIWAIQSVMASDAGNARMQEIAGAIREGATAYLTRQYTTIAIVGAVVFVLAWWLLWNFVRLVANFHSCSSKPLHGS